ncbi:uncharacterized protein LOC128963854 [Oppia nitens]|uniref:uncharacterized protein LOC128963854 n=1 Tax=Oppia nitens TaxID=1686743 RepID=UPI0023DA13AD|nr:uncharacterized protein LOC128963854 [Oppia nitens]
MNLQSSESIDLKIRTLREQLSNKLSELAVEKDYLHELIANNIITTNIFDDNMMKLIEKCNRLQIKANYVFKRNKKFMTTDLNQIQKAFHCFNQLMDNSAALKTCNESVGKNKSLLKSQMENNQRVLDLFDKEIAELDEQNVRLNNRLIALISTNDQRV